MGSCGEAKQTWPKHSGWHTWEVGHGARLAASFDIGQRSATARLGLYRPYDLHVLKHFVRQIHPDDQARVMERVRRAVDEKIDFEVDCRIAHPDRETRNIHLVGHPSLDSYENFRESVGAVIDVTDRKQSRRTFAQNTGRTCTGRQARDRR